MLNKKGQEEFADVLTSLLFIAVAVIAFALLGLFSGGERQEIIGKFGPEIEAREELLIYMMTPADDEKAVSDLVADAVNADDFEPFKNYTETSFKPDFEWIMFILDSEDKQLFETHKFEAYYDYTYKVDNIEKVLRGSGNQKAFCVEQFIPNYKNEIPIKLVICRLDEWENE